jgi:ectoine hydroxylase-related dioxygenase (phytanoyl-CoA dioxygenase family)
MVAAAAFKVQPEQIAAYHRDGFLVVLGLFSQEEIATIRDTFMELGKNGPVEGLSEMRRKNSGGYDPNDPLAFYPRMMHPHRHPKLSVGPLAMRYMLDQRIGAVLAALLEDEPIAAQSMFYFKPPGARGQDFHQDNFYLRVKPGSCMAAWTAIDDADESNGGMMVVPGSHTLDIACPEKANRAEFFTDDHVEIPAGMSKAPTNLKAGVVLFFNGSLIHGSYPTKSDRFRRALICHYVPARCIEVSEYYRPLLRFTGEVVGKEAATGGGPCGNLAEPTKTIH